MALQLNHYPSRFLGFKNLFVLAGIIALLASCGTQKRALLAQQKASEARLQIKSEQVLINSVEEKVNEKLAAGEIDTTIKSEFKNVLEQLGHQLASVEKRIQTLETFIENKASFRGSNYNKVMPYMAALDSFNLLKAHREQLYQLIKEAITVKAFSLYNMAAFFEPGVYHIPPQAINTISATFMPAIDSIAKLANKYTGIPCTIRMVFTGFADGAGIDPNSALYKDLSRRTLQAQPSSPELNRVLSHLRAKEMERNMKILSQSVNQKFNSLPHINFEYTSYGRGEEYPSSKIKDYQINDERRRIVMFYWSVLPNL